MQSASWCCGSSEPQGKISQSLTEVSVQLLRYCSLLAAMLAAPGAFAADADNGRRLAEMRCITCHIVSPGERRVVTDAPPFEAIARKYAASPDTLAFSIMNPHPRMNMTLTRREAQDVAAYINTLAK
jgi:mono/diheme cytochrome c family protein